MARVETTTIRVRRYTHERLRKEAELAGQSVTQVLEDAVELIEEQRLLEGMARSASMQRFGGPVGRVSTETLELASRRTGALIGVGRARGRGAAK